MSDWGSLTPNERWAVEQLRAHGHADVTFEIRANHIVRCVKNLSVMPPERPRETAR